MKAALLAIGDELALGQTVDTNSAWIAQRLAERGVHVSVQMTVSDDLSAITRAIAYVWQEADLIIATGGLGPTDDDLSRQALADYLEEELVFDEKALDMVQAFFDRRHRVMAERNRVQAYRPTSAQCLDNPVGTAPALYVEKENTELFWFAGVPREMKTLYQQYIPPVLPEGADHVILTRKINTYGLGESNMAEVLGNFCDRNRNPLIGTTVANGYVSLRIRSEFPTLGQAESQMEHTLCELQACLGSLLISTEDITLAQCIAEMLTERGQTLATAESCTGGLIAKVLTDIPGSSAFFLNGWVTYSNQHKNQQLQVDKQTLLRHGAVSAQVAEELAVNALRQAGTDYALSVTGIAGPTGGSEDKPVGLVYLGLAWKDSSNTEEETVIRCTVNETHQIGDRAGIRMRSMLTSLNMLRLYLLGDEN